MRYFSAFSGIGGFELGIHKAYENHHRRKTKTASPQRHRRVSSRRDSRDHASKHVEAPPVCVGYSENDPYAASIYQKNFPTHKNYGDITKIKTKELPDFDLFIGGFPCQSFSVAGRRRGFEDTRGTLFFEIERIVREKRPRLLLLENVKGLLSHDKGKTFFTIVSTLDELGYDLQWQVLNSKHFGVPQNRERVYIVGHLRGTPRPQVFPIGDFNQGTSSTRQTLREEVANTLKAKQGGPDLENSYEIIQRGRGKNKGGKHKIAPTLTGKSYQDNNHVSGIRKLTPTECERLQGFPDNWTRQRITTTNMRLLGLPVFTNTEVSDTQRYKVLGNAVTVNVVCEIIGRMVL